ncbi:MAG: alpha/beta fold hydrolase [Rothia sp. (in: high G+C Gram-positive bacteria)]|nr:alpha/beta fold hydrolase [Rothia sp. (in: high G+C Gram-positive bacteria)]
MSEHMKLSTEQIGAGTHRVVFLHGLMGRGKNFTTIAKRLSVQFTSLLVDLPNHGASPWTVSFDYDEMADIVAENLRADFAASGPVDVVGHSMGGKVAMRLALRHQELVRRLVVLDIAPSASRGNFDHLLGSLLALPLDEFSTRGQANKALAPAVAEDGTRGFLLQNLTTDGEHFAWEPNLTMLYNNLDHIMGWETPMETFDQPVLWVAGEKSHYITPADTEPMRAMFPRVRKITLKGAGHWVHADKPDEIIYMLQTFLLDQ